MSREPLLGRLGHCDDDASIRQQQGHRVVEAGNPARRIVADLPAAIAAQVLTTDSVDAAPGLRAVLFDGAGEELIALNRRMAARDGPILPVLSPASDALAAGEDYDLDRLLEEVSIATNTAAAGGNASLMSIG